MVGKFAAEMMHLKYKTRSYLCIIMPYKALVGLQESLIQRKGQLDSVVREAVAPAASSRLKKPCTAQASLFQ